MDELLHHCLRELSFDGDLGCDVSRLRDFIVGFYTHSGTPQTPDDAFCAFVWSLVVQQPTVRIGTIPPGVTSEVWIAPQTSAKRKAKEKGEGHIETKPTELDLVPDAKKKTLLDLKQEYGDNLRIALDSDAIYAAITGSHIRFPKLSPMVYSALQIITRGRDNGVTVVELGQKSKYDQKTCFYLVRQLTELDLVVKVRRGGVGTHFCIHKYFFERSPSWNSIREEELRADDTENVTQELTMEPLDEEDDRTTDPQSLEFTPIDARHLSSLPLIRARVVKLLKASRNQMHACNNILITIGFSNPSKTDRRFFQSRIRELIQQGVIEKVVVPSNRKKSLNASVRCFRLVSKDQSQEDADEDGVVIQPADGDDDERDIGGQSGIKMNLTIHKQIIDLLEDAGMVGMTLNELSVALSRFDKRTIELLLTRAEKFPPPSHLSDLGIAAVMETSGRERRHRYYTVASYRKLVTKENLDSAGYADVDFTRVGGFLEVDPRLFYHDQNALYKYQDEFKDKAKAKNAKPRKHPPKNPVLPDGTIKQGRPRKHPVPGEQKTGRKTNKRKRNEDDVEDERTPDTEQTQPAKKRRVEEGDGVKKRGRPPKDKPEEVEKLPKKRGRPPKHKPDLPKKRSSRTKQSGSGENDQGTAEQGKRNRSEPIDIDNDDMPKKRGRLDKEPLAIGDIEMIRPLDGDVAMMGSPLSDISSSTESDIEQPEIMQPPPSQNERGQQQSDHFVSPGAGSPPRVPVGLDEGNLPISAPSGPNTSPTIPTRHVLTKVIEFAPSHSPRRHASPGGSRKDPITLGLPITSHLGHSMRRDASLEQDPTFAKSTEAVQESKKVGVPRFNVSHLRRENELYRVIESMGGIVNIQTKEFFEEHMALLETMAKAGEATSAPVGTRTDKRTAATTFNNMERRGRIKQLKTAIMTHTGVRRPACIIYLPTIEQGKLNAYLADLARGVQPTPPQQGPVLKLDERVEYGADPTSVARGALPLQLLQMEEPGTDRKERWSKNVARANQLFSYDDNVIREVLLTERTTLGQLYGFIVGKVVRARELHLSALSAFDSGNPSTNIISRNHRILDVSFFVHDIPLGLYCSLVSSLSHDGELTQFIATDEGRQTLARDLPSNLNFMLQIGRSRARSRFLDILEMLRALKLVTPLQPSTSASPWITCEPREDRPCAFDMASLDGWTVSTPMAAPVYWHINGVAPLHVWAVSEVAPPFWQDVPVACHVEGMEYWRLLQEACTNASITTLPEAASTTGPPSDEISVARSLRRGVSWNADYILTWHQMQYMRQFTEPSTARTPLQDEDGGEPQIQKISWVIGAPPTTVRAFFETTREKLLKESQKSSRKAGRKASAKRAAEAKASLAQKAAAARNQREEEWNSMLLRLHAEPLEGAASIRVRRVRNRFLQAGTTRDIRKWETEVVEALREAETVSKQVLKAVEKRTFVSRAAPVPVVAPPAAVANPPQTSVEALIAQQGPAFIPKAAVKRKRGGKEIEGPEFPENKPKVLRRHRFQWNRDYEELARDASAIIKARCRGLSRLDWAAFEQVFPAVPRNTVRQRLAHIREIPGNETYLNRLEDRWYELWVQHRGTPLLPDDNPQSPSNFNLIKHIEFLRQHVDKNALRVGFSQPKENAGTIIPVSLNEILELYDVVEAVPSIPTWDFVWNAVVEEGREKRMLRQPFNKALEEMPFNGEGQSEAISLAESALKIALGTPNERYDPELASALLHNVGEQFVSPAARRLLNRGVLSKLVRDPQKQKPGRQLKISEVNQNAIGGSISRDTFQDAAALEDISIHDTWHEWPLLATDGDLVALIQLVSEHKVEFKVDTSQAQLARPTLDWNSKKADDDQIETTIYIRAEELPETSSMSRIVDSSPVATFAELGNEVSAGHGLTVDNDVACCRRISGTGVVDCTACLEEEWASIQESLDPQEVRVATQVLAVVRDAKEQGVTKSHAQGIYNGHHLAIIRKLTESSVPLLFWAGYSTLVLVSSAYLKPWTVLVCGNPATRVFPRRWLDISGLKIVDFWEAALRAAMGVIIFRPGISHAELRWRLRSVYDRQEVNDLVRYLEEEGFVKMRVECFVDRDGGGIVGGLDEREEKGVFWLIGDERRWYQV